MPEPEKDQEKVVGTPGAAAQPVKDADEGEPEPEPLTDIDE